MPQLQYCGVLAAHPTEYTVYSITPSDYGSSHHLERVSVYIFKLEVRVFSMQECYIMAYRLINPFY